MLSEEEQEEEEEWGSGGRVLLGGTRRGLFVVDEVAGRTKTKAVEKERKSASKETPWQCLRRSMVGLWSGRSGVDGRAVMLRRPLLVFRLQVQVLLLSLWRALHRTSRAACRACKCAMWV